MDQRSSRIANRGALLSASEEFPSQFRRPKHIRGALQVVGHRRDADFSSCPGQSTQQQTGMSERGGSGSVNAATPISWRFYLGTPRFCLPVRLWALRRPPSNP